MKLDGGDLFALALAIVIVILMLRAWNTRQKCGKMIVKLHHRPSGFVLFICVFVSMAFENVAQQRFGDSYEVLIVTVILLAAVLHLLFDKSYLGERGLKIGFEFFPRNKLYHFLVAEKDRRLTITFYLDGSDRTIEATALRRRDDAEFEAKVSEYFKLVDADKV